MFRRAVASRRNDLHSVEGLRLCFPFRPGYGARNIADIVKIRCLPVIHAFHLLMDLRHLSLAEARRLPKRLFKCLGCYDQAVMAEQAGIATFKRLDGIIR